MLRGERLQGCRIVGIRQHEERIARLQYKVIARRKLMRPAAHIDEDAARRPERIGRRLAVESRLHADRQLQEDAPMADAARDLLAHGQAAREQHVVDGRAPVRSETR